MEEQHFPSEFLERLKAITHKRARIVVDHILRHGFITTEELKSIYGYNHPPRAARDVREEGIPLETFHVKSAEGRTIAAYRFGDPLEVRSDRLGGRGAFSKQFKKALIAANGSRCSICRQPYEARYLQIDHRVPYEVAGNIPQVERNLTEHMLLCGSCNRAKSWSCEHCKNWLELKSPEHCRTCYWASPESYRHIALRQFRRLDVVWTEDETATYDNLHDEAEAARTPMADYVKAIIKKHVEGI